MPKISKDDVSHVAELARLNLKEEETEKMTEEIGEILNYVDELNSIDTKNIEPISQVSGLKNATREDEITNKPNREKLLINAPEQKNGYIKVKKVFES